MSTWRTTTASIMASGALIITAAPAQAQRAAITDEAGDTPVPGLDITHVNFQNRDRAVVVDFEFTGDRRGSVIVLVKARHGSRVVLVSDHLRRGPDETAFFSSGDSRGCARFTSSWDRRAAQLRLRMPARCLDAGNYGAIRARALTEEFGGGADVDYAPQTPDGDLAPTEWTSRG